jgi:hypothetical protein
MGVNSQGAEYLDVTKPENIAVTMPAGLSIRLCRFRILGVRRCRPRRPEVSG